MKYFIAAALVSLSQAGKGDFPKFDSFHAHCQLSSEVTGTCAEVWTALDNTLKTMADPAQGTYKVKEDGSNDYVWATRTTPVKKYVDDIMFTVSPSTNNDTCTVTGKSRSQTLSYYDYETNFCNLYNVLRS